MKSLVCTFILSLISLSASASTIKCTSGNGSLEISKISANLAIVSAEMISQENGNPISVLKSFLLEQDDGGGYDENSTLGHASYTGFATPWGNTILPHVKVNVIQYEKSNGMPQISFSIQEKNIHLKFESCAETKSLAEKMGYSRDTQLSQQ